MNVKKRQKVFVAMSGGVDSSVAAALLQADGFDVSGIHIKMWSDPDIPCTFKEDRYDAMKVAAKLGIPFQTWDFTRECREAVVEYMIREYAAGRTPNPDIMCNRHIKFGVFLKKSFSSGADFIATGHYAKISSPKAFRTKSRRRHLSYGSGYSLTKAKDSNKDQSYFLWTLVQEQLRRCLFPIGIYTKPEVRALAKKFGLPTAEKEESQGICFIGEINIREFLKKHIASAYGPVRTTTGKVIGEHAGLQFYTIGQRQGLRIGGGIPYYVVEKNFATNTLFVVEGPYDEKLFSRELMATNTQWISGVAPRFPFRCEARIRYRQQLQKCIVTSQSSTRDNLYVIFNEPQRAVTSGQSVVFYKGEILVGGGVIA